MPVTSAEQRETACLECQARRIRVCRDDAGGLAWADRTMFLTGVAERECALGGSRMIGQRCRVSRREPRSMICNALPHVGGRDAMQGKSVSLYAFRRLGGRSKPMFFIPGRGLQRVLSAADRLSGVVFGDRGLARSIDRHGRSMSSELPHGRWRGRVARNPGRCEAVRLRAAQRLTLNAGGNGAGAGMDAVTATTRNAFHRDAVRQNPK